MAEKEYELILASASPRRRELLDLIGRPFEVIAPDIDETPRPGERPLAYARRAAAEKAAAVAARLPKRVNARRIVIGCDTIVVLGDRILGKPADADDACRMLRALSARWHRVISGLSVLREGLKGVWHERTLAVVTRVRFRRLSPEEIVAYVASGEPMDKAGAYAVQGGAAGMVAEISGSYTNVVGLPLAELIELLRWQGLRKPGRGFPPRRR